MIFLSIFSVSNYNDKHNDYEHNEIGIFAKRAKGIFWKNAKRNKQTLGKKVESRNGSRKCEFTNRYFGERYAGKGEEDKRTKADKIQVFLLNSNNNNKFN